MKSKAIPFFSVILVFTFCTNEEELFKRDYPVLKTNSVSNITAQGATFNAEIIEFNGYEIIDHGFIWGPDYFKSSGVYFDRDNDLTKDPNEMISLGPLGSNSFSSTVKTTIQPNETYVVRSFIRTSQKTIFGNEIIFN